ncbi:hypothetical protein O4G76_19350 [Limimaricola sp. G21655-S1]|uniref:hypothetical protein n=1 Tax=Limimaricola sp. G21655-S1 TaxID=3014768 RepID=UPI0022AF0992|nr:hypothetical protein [Limimaricola sp. G21655-S1]MCZ4262988.1 hypothetical protein [Limimaricola sp. G21655-S1]
MIDGIYIAYFASKAGNSMGMFVFKNGIIAGGDIGGWVYKGEYTVGDDGFAEGAVTFEIPAGAASITGVTADDQPLSVRVPIHLPVIIDPDETYRIETPQGPLNAKFRKVTGA